MTIPKWKITGDYIEACNNETFCPSAFNSPPTYGEDTGLAVWQIRKGNYGTIPLSGLNAAGMYIFKGRILDAKWQVRLYIDDKANEEQREALEGILLGRKGGFMKHSGSSALFSNYLGVRYVPIRITVKGRTRIVTVNNYVYLKVSELKGYDGGQVILKNPPVSWTTGYDKVVAQSLVYKYNDDGRQWEISGKHSYFAKFKYTGP